MGSEHTTYVPVRMTFKDLFGQGRLHERLTFDQLFRLSDQDRVERSRTVRGPALEVLQWNDATGYAFNFKSNPSTTGLRHRGYIRFYKPRKKTPLQNIECLVDCECPDFKYRWAWANKQRRSSMVGSNSLNQAWDRAPRITNPSGSVGLCKHLLALRDYIYGQYEKIGTRDQEEEDNAIGRLDRMTKRATKRWIDYSGAVAQGAERTELNRELARKRKEKAQREKELAAMPEPPEVPPKMITPVGTEDYFAPQPGAAAPAPPDRPRWPTFGDSLVVRDMKTRSKLTEALKAREASVIKLVEEIEDEMGGGDDAGEEVDGETQALELLGEILATLQQMAGIEDVEVPGEEGDEDILDVTEPAPGADTPPRPVGAEV